MQQSVRPGPLCSILWMSIGVLVFVLSCVRCAIFGSGFTTSNADIEPPVKDSVEGCIVLQTQAIQVAPSRREPWSVGPEVLPDLVVVKQDPEAGYQDLSQEQLPMKLSQEQPPAKLAKSAECRQCGGGPTCAEAPGQQAQALVSYLHACWPMS